MDDENKDYQEGEMMGMEGDSDNEQPLQILSQYLSMPNIAEVDDDTLKSRCGMTLADIGDLILREYKADLLSREDWEKRNEMGLKLARQVKDGRKYAGEPIADVKYPTIASAAIQYAARAYPAIVKDREVVKYMTVGMDKDGAKAARGARVAQYLNWQLLVQSENWDEDMDTLLFVQPVLGSFFKKVYHDPMTGRTKIELVWPDDLIVYYLAPNFDTWPRKTQIVPMDHNDYLSRVRMGEFLDLDLKPTNADDPDAGQHIFLEQHRTLDLDGDGYAEPYIVTILEDTGEVTRIVPCFSQNSIQLNQAKEIIRIEPNIYYIRYLFMPAFDGGVYGMGLGILLGPLNDSINTLLNQILDAGTRANFQSGFIGKGIRLMRGGESGSMRFQRGEWKIVQSTGDNLRNNIVPLPLTEPSSVLFQLLGFLVQASKELSSNSDLLAGQQEQHNIPATSTLALIEQGLKVFSGIYKRTYRSCTKEYKLIHRLNAIYPNEQEYQMVVDDPQASIADFVMADYDITPINTTATITETQQYLKAQSLMALQGKGLDDMAINLYYMEALGIPNVQQFLPKQPPQPPPQFVLAMRELDIKQMQAQTELEKVKVEAGLNVAKAREMRMREVKLQADAIEALAKAESLEPGSQLAFYKAKMAELLQLLFEAEKAEEQRQMEEATARARIEAAKQQAAQPQGPLQPPPPSGPRPVPRPTATPRG